MVGAKNRDSMLFLSKGGMALLDGIANPATLLVSMRTRGCGPVPRIGMARVHGRSMLPTLHEGDRLLVAHDVRVSPGDLVVVRLPDGVVALKRATVRQGPGWWVERDNPHEGVDSARVGAIADDDVLAVVLLRLWPSPRRRFPPPSDTT